MTDISIDFEKAGEVANDLGDILVHVLTYVAERSPAPIAAEKLRANLDSNGAYWAKVPDQRIIVVLPFKFSLFTTDEADPVELGQLFLQYQIVYTLGKSLESWADAALQSFAAYYGTSHIWPFLRADVQALTSKIGMPSLTLPVLKHGHLPAGFSIKQASEDDADADDEG